MENFKNIYIDKTIPENINIYIDRAILKISILIGSF